MKGLLSHDNITINNVTVARMPFLSAYFSKDFGLDSPEGLMGLGFSREKNTLNLVAQMKEQSLIQQGVFSLRLDWQPCSRSSHLRVG